MNKPVIFSIKVNRVKNIEEIQILEGLKVNYIGLHVDNDVYFGIDDNPLWQDDRYLTESDIADLSPFISHAKGFVECPGDVISEAFVCELSDQSIKLIQSDGRVTPDARLIALCKTNGISFIYDAHYVVPEDNPGFPGIINGDWPLRSFFELQLFPSETDAWSFLIKDSIRYAPDVITIDDITKLAARVPLFISLNANVENINQIIQTLIPMGIAGLSFTLSSTKLGSFHTFGFHELTNMLKAIDTRT